MKNNFKNDIISLSPSPDGTELRKYITYIRNSGHDIYGIRDAILALGGVYIETNVWKKLAPCRAMLNAIPRSLAPLYFHYACRDALRGSPLLSVFLYLTLAFDIN